MKPRLDAKGITSNGTVVQVAFIPKVDRMFGYRYYVVDFTIRNAKGKGYHYAYEVPLCIGTMAYDRIATAKYIGERLVALEMFGRPNKSGHHGLVPHLQKQSQTKNSLIRRLK